MESVDNLNRKLENSFSNDEMLDVPGNLPTTRNEFEKLIRGFQSQNELKVSFLPLDRLNSGEELAKSSELIKEVISSGKFTSGPYLLEIEQVLKSRYDIAMTVLQQVQVQTP